jgi:hypothetical protein
VSRRSCRCPVQVRSARTPLLFVASGAHARVFSNSAAAFPLFSRVVCRGVASPAWSRSLHCAPTSPPNTVSCLPSCTTPAHPMTRVQVLAWTASSTRRAGRLF